MDAWATWDPFLSVALQNGSARLLVDGAQAGSENAIAFFVSQDFLHAHGAVVEAVYDVLRSENAWARAHKQEAGDIWAKERGLPAAVATRLGEYNTNPIGPVGPAETKRYPADAASSASLPDAHASCALIEHISQFGRGLAYATGNPSHILNVPAARMSAFHDWPNDFLDWLAVQPDADPTVGPGTFASRRRFGAYIRALLNDEVKRSGRERLELVKGDVTGLDRTARPILLTLVTWRPGNGRILDERIHPDTRSVAITRRSAAPGRPQADFFHGLGLRSGYALPSPQAMESFSS